MSTQTVGSHVLQIFSFGQIWPLTPSFKVKQGSIIFKGPKTHLLLVLAVWNVKSTYGKPCAQDLLMRLDLTFDPSLKIKEGQPSLKDQELTYYWP